MARNYTGGTPEQKEFVKLFDTLTGRYNRWEVWKDMVWMIAIAISNSVDKRYFDQREKTYLDIVKKYSKKEMDTFVALYGLLFTSIVDRTERGNWGDFLGELFMNLDLGNELGGQFFTPYHVCHMMSRITIEADLPQMKKEIEENGWFSCYDSAVGAGAMLIAAAEVCAEQKINYPFQVMFTAQEIDSTTALMCYIQLSLLGCAGYVVIGDTLAKPATGNVLFGENSERCWFTPMFFEEIWHQRREIEVTRQRVRLMMNVIGANKPASVETELTEDAVPEEEAPAALPAPETSQETVETSQEPSNTSQSITTPPQEPAEAAVPDEPTNPAPPETDARTTPRRLGKHIEGQLSLFDF